MIWKWNVRPFAALPFTSNAEHCRLGITVGGRLAAIAALGMRIVKVGAQMRDEVFPHPLGGASGERLLERRARDARRLDRARAQLRPRSAVHCEAARA